MTDPMLFGVAADLDDDVREELAQVRERALLWANGERKRKGLELIDDFEPGEVMDPRCCPMAKAIEEPVYFNGYGYRHQDWPDDVAPFIAYVTAGLYSDLVES